MNTFDDNDELLINFYDVPEKLLDFAYNTLGETIQTQEVILYWVSGYRSFDQLEEEF